MSDKIARLIVGEIQSIVYGKDGVVGSAVVKYPGDIMSLDLPKELEETASKLAGMKVKIGYDNMSGHLYGLITSIEAVKPTREK